MGSRAKMVVLVVEDEPIVRIAAAAALEEAGFEVYEAENAVEAAKLLAQRDDFGALFTDIEMPGVMNGLALARFASAHFRRLKIIVASGRHNVNPALLPHGALFLPKPYRLEEVVEALRR